jgi:hypothetical protein
MEERLVRFCRRAADAARVWAGRDEDIGFYISGDDDVPCSSGMMSTRRRPRARRRRAAGGDLAVAGADQGQSLTRVRRASISSSPSRARRSAWFMAKEMRPSLTSKVGRGVRTYLASPRMDSSRSLAAVDSDRPPSPASGSSRGASWTAWAGHKIKQIAQGSSASSDAARARMVEKIYVFPGWASRRYHDMDNTPSRGQVRHFHSLTPKRLLMDVSQTRLSTFKSPSPAGARATIHLAPSAAPRGRSSA